MNQSLLGSILPIWIIGAPLLVAVIELMRTPKPERSGRNDEMRSPYTGAPRHAAAS